MEGIARSDTGGNLVPPGENPGGSQGGNGGTAYVTLESLGGPAGTNGDSPAGQPAKRGPGRPRKDGTAAKPRVVSQSNAHQAINFRFLEKMSLRLDTTLSAIGVPKGTWIIEREEIELLDEGVNNLSEEAHAKIQKMMENMAAPLLVVLVMAIIVPRGFITYMALWGNKDGTKDSGTMAGANGGKGTIGDAVPNSQDNASKVLGGTTRTVTSNAPWTT